MKAINDLSPLDSESGPALRISTKRSSELVDNIVARLREPVATPRPEVRRQWRGSISRRSTWLVAAAVLASGVAGATVWSHMRTGTANPLPPHAAVESVPVGAPVEPPPPTDPTGSAIDPAAPPVATPGERSSSGQKKRLAQSATGANVLDLMRLANQLRSERRWGDAAVAYGHVAAISPDSDEACTALVAVAGLQLDHLSDTPGAIRRYRRALAQRPDGPLAEEAAWGLARSLRRKGDGMGERGALERFIDHFPKSVHAAEGGARLEELGGRRR